MAQQTFNLGDPVVRVSTGEWGTIAGIGTRAPDPSVKYTLDIPAWTNPSTGEQTYRQVFPVPASDLVFRDDATSGAPTPPATGGAQ